MLKARATFTNLEGVDMVVFIYSPGQTMGIKGERKETQGLENKRVKGIKEGEKKEIKDVR